MFKTLRTVWNLAARVDEVERLAGELRSEWTDTLDLLQKREARERMRALRSVRSSLDDAPPPQATGPLANGKSALRARARAQGLAPDPRGGVQ